MAKNYRFYRYDGDLCRIADGELTGDNWLEGRWIRGTVYNVDLSTYGRPVSYGEAKVMISKEKVSPDQLTADA